MRPSDLRKVYRARQAGARHAFKIVQEARRERVPLDLAFALVEQESGFKNIFGCDYGAGRAFCHEHVTARKVKQLLASSLANGVGLTQLTYKPFVQQAEREGGAHKPRYQLRIGFRIIRSHLNAYSYYTALARYNGSGPAAERYATELHARRRRWNKTLHS